MRRPALLRLRHRRRAAGRAGRRLADVGLGPERGHARSARPPPRWSRRSPRAGCSTLLGLPAERERRLRHRRARWPTSPASRRRATRCCDAAGWDVARDGLIGAPPLTVIVGAQAHATIFSALRLLGLGADPARLGRRPTPRARSTPRRARERARDAGPAIVCAQAGNVNTGAFDPLEPIAALRASSRRLAARRRRVRAVGGAPARATRTSAGGVERADSWATDAHKWLNVPYDCGLAIVARPRGAPRRDGPQRRLPRRRASQRDELRLDARGLAPRPRLRGLRRAALARPPRRRRAGRALLRAAPRCSPELLRERRRGDPQRRRAQPGAGAPRVAGAPIARHPGRRARAGPAAPSGAAARRCGISVSNWATTDADVERSARAILVARSAVPEELQDGLAALVRATPWTPR